MKKVSWMLADNLVPENFQGDRRKFLVANVAASIEAALRTYSPENLPKIASQALWDEITKGRRVEQVPSFPVYRSPWERPLGELAEFEARERRQRDEWEQRFQKYLVPPEGQALTPDRYGPEWLKYVPNEELSIQFDIPIDFPRWWKYLW